MRSNIILTVKIKVKSSNCWECYHAYNRTIWRRFVFTFVNFHKYLSCSDCWFQTGMASPKALTHFIFIRWNIKQIKFVYGNKSFFGCSVKVYANKRKTEWVKLREIHDKTMFFFLSVSKNVCYLFAISVLFFMHLSFCSFMRVLFALVLGSKEWSFQTATVCQVADGMKNIFQELRNEATLTGNGSRSTDCYTFTFR